MLNKPIVNAGEINRENTDLNNHLGIMDVAKENTKNNINHLIRKYK